MQHFEILAWALTVLFWALAALHVYWALGGGAGSAPVIPTQGGKPVFEPGAGSTLLVALLLLVAGALCLWRAGLLAPELPAWIPEAGTVSLAVLFGLRAIGEFRLVGFFKRVRDTPFAWWDTRIFSPLCLLISMGCAALSNLAP